MVLEMKKRLRATLMRLNLFPSALKSGRELSGFVCIMRYRIHIS